MNAPLRTRTAPLPTEAELDLLNILWSRGPSTVREVHEALSGTREVGYTTVLKQMQLMTEKGLVRRSERFRSHVYAARIARDQTRRRLAGDLLDRAFAGSARDLVLGALGARRVSAEELAEIRTLLDRYERERNGVDAGEQDGALSQGSTKEER